MYGANRPTTTAYAQTVAHQRAEREGAVVTDDAMVVERTGTPVYVLEGERTNFKITQAEDVWLAEMLLREGRVP